MVEEFPPLHPVTWGGEDINGEEVRGTTQKEEESVLPLVGLA